MNYIEQIYKQKFILTYYATFGMVYAELNQTIALSEIRHSYNDYGKNMPLVELLDISKNKYSIKKLRDNLRAMCDDLSWDIDFLNGVLENYNDHLINSGALKAVSFDFAGKYNKSLKNFSEFLTKYNAMFKDSLKSLMVLIREPDQSKVIEIYKNLSENIETTFKDIVSGYIPLSFEDKTAEKLKSIMELYSEENIKLIETSTKIVESLNILNNAIDEFKIDESFSLNKERLLIEEQRKQEFEEQKAKEIEAQRLEEENRIYYINKANDLYDRLCNDFMLDLEKQIPYSTRKNYEEFINVSFKKFVDEYKMPLSRMASKKDAVTCCDIINNLFDKISEISSKSYVTTPVQRGE